LKNRLLTKLIFKNPLSPYGGKNMKRNLRVIAIIVMAALLLACLIALTWRAGEVSGQGGYMLPTTEIEGGYGYGKVQY